jgi:serine/threonine-protein kinase
LNEDPPGSNSASVSEAGRDEETTVMKSMARIGIPLDLDAFSVERLLDEVLVDPEKRHEYGEIIGRGGMGTVYLATDQRLRRTVAIKMLDERLATDLDSVAQFIREARVAANLDHPNAAPVHDLGVRDGHHAYFTMKYVQGRTLSDDVRQRPLSERTYHQLLDQVSAVIQVANAASAAHDVGFVHCDIKPANIMLGRFGAVYLMDWGLAQPLGSASARPGDEATAAATVVREDDPEWLQAKTAGVVGTPAYMAPEQANGWAVDPRTDVFALGSVLYFLLTGRAPFKSSNAKKAILKARSCTFSRPSDMADNVPPALEAIVLRAMARSPDDRYQSAEAMAAALTSFQRGGGEFPTVHYAAGQSIITQGEEADAAYVIVSGRCTVSRERGGETTVLRTMGPGEVFGETAIIAKVPRTASVVADEPTAVYRITRDVFESEMSRWSPWVGDFVLQLARRLAEG